MKLNRVLFAAFLAACMVAVVPMGEAEGQQKPGGSSSGGSSTKPGGSSGSSTKPPTGGSGSDKPKFSSPPPTQKDPPKNEDKPKFTAPPANNPPKKDEDKPKFTAPNTKPPVGPVVGSEKPKSGGDTSDKARANKENRSETKFIETQKAVAPPKPKYTTPDGKEVAVRTATKDVEHIRNMPSSSLKPEVRQQNVNVHVTNYHYQHPYTYYQSQPTFYVGGGYSSAFWYMMAEWDAERRARWLYNHQYDITQDAYQRGLQDAKTAEALRRLEQQRAYRDPNYTDPEFKNDPSLQYTDEYLHASYNPPVHQSEPTDPGAALNVLAILGCIVLGGLILWGLYVVLFKVRWGN